jgi:hypothetical protein
MAVVTDVPFAIGVRYSVVGFGSLGFLLASTFCWARIASFEGGRESREALLEVGDGKLTGERRLLVDAVVDPALC